LQQVKNLVQDDMKDLGPKMINLKNVKHDDEAGTDEEGLTTKQKIN